MKEEVKQEAPSPALPYRPELVDTRRRRVQFETTGQTMTRQSHKAECDINNIVNRFNKDGVITHLQKHGEKYDDVTGADYRQWMNKLVEAQQMFDELPSNVRNRFGNDPGAFLDFVQDEKNLPEMRNLGLAKGLPENPADSTLMSPNTPNTVNNPPLPNSAPAPTSEASAATSGAVEPAPSPVQ